MHKKLFLISFIMLITAVFLHPGRMEDYLDAVNQKDPATKFELLEGFVQKYGKKQDKYLRYAYIQACDTAFKLNNHESTINYGEKAMAFTDISEGNELRVLYLVANSYQMSKKDMDKAVQYSNKMMELSKAVMEKTRDANIEEEKKEQFLKTQRKYYIGGAYRIQAVVLYEQAKQNPELYKEAAQKAVEAFKNDPNDKMFRMILVMANEMYKKRNLNGAIAAVESALEVDNTKMTERIANFLATMHYKNGSKETAITYYEKAYQVRRKASTALKIGKLVYKKNIDKGIKYFADAFVMSKQDKESDAYKYLQELYYNRKAKGLPTDQQEKGFQEIVQASQARVGSPGGGSAPTDQN